MNSASNLPFKLIPFFTGRAIPQIGYGTYQLKGPDCVYGVLSAIKAGYRHIDTASVYKNESDIKEALETLYKAKYITREELFITSKIGPSQQGYDQALKACDEILEKLNTPYLDLLIIHWPGVSSNKPQDQANAEVRLQTWKALEKLKEIGKVKDIGVSNFLKKHLEHLLTNSKTVPVLNQFELHPLCYDVETIEYCKEKGIVVEAYSPLARRDDLMFKNPSVIKISDKYKRTIAQILLRWSIQHGFVTLPKSKTEEFILENFKIFDFELEKDDMLILDSLNKDYHTCWNPEAVEF